MPPAEPVQLGAAASDLIDIVTRAYRLGFCRWRVATALGVVAHDLEVIERIPGRPWARPITSRDGHARQPQPPTSPS